LSFTFIEPILIITQVPSHISLEIATLHFPSVLMHDVTTEESSFK